MRHSRVPATNSLTEIDRFVLAARLKGYLGSNQDALAILSEGLREYPDDVRLQQLRGIKRLIARDLPGALADLTRAAAGLTGLPDSHEFYRSVVEDDVVNLVLAREGWVGGRPPAARSRDLTDGVAKGTVHATTWHHLGLAHYLMRSFDDAAAAFAQARSAAVEEHQTVAAIDWQYMSLRRAGRVEDAGQALVALEAVRYDPGLLDSPNVAGSLNGWYVQRLRMYRGELQPQDLLRNDSNDPLAIATLGYGVGNWYLYNGHQTAARRTFDRVLEFGDPTSVGYLAAEREAISSDIRISPAEP